MNQPSHLVLSMDTGVDDALALAYLLAHPNAQIHGISATYGNVQATTAAYNTQAILELFDRSDIPVRLGATHPSWATAFVADAGCAMFHGSNGLAGLDLTHYGLTHIPEPVLPQTPCIHQMPQKYEILSVGGYTTDDPHAFLSNGEEAIHEHKPSKLTTHMSCITDGARMILEAAHQYGSQLTVLATGPLTDIDAALHADPKAMHDVRIVFMGGALTQEGNCYDLVCETNIIQDPEAARHVFHSGLDITMVGLDVTHRCLMGSDACAAWNAQNSDRARFLADLAQFSIHANAVSDPMFAQGMPLHDPLAAAVALEPSLVQTFNIPMTVEVQTGDGTGVRGRTIGNPHALNDSNAAAMHVALGVDGPAFVHQFVTALVHFLTPPKRRSR